MWETATRLLIAEYFLYRLSGVKVAEATMASTTQLVDARTGAWALDLIEAIGDDERRWPRIVPPGTVLGPLLPELVPAGVDRAPAVLACCAHDTASAVAAVPATGERPWAFISSGTWSLVGMELDAPVLDAAAREHGFTNEAGLDGTVRFLKNRAGMWVLEECRREWEEQGTRYSHEALFRSAAESASLGAVDRPERAGVRRPRRHGAQARRRVRGARRAMRRRRTAASRGSILEIARRRATPPRSTSSKS